MHAHAKALKALQGLALLALLGLSALACAAPAAAPAAAQTYRVDLIVFLDLYHAGDEAGEPLQTPDLRGAIELQDSAALAAQGIRILPEGSFALQQQWSRLANSQQFRPLLKLAFTQTEPPSRRGPALHFTYGSPLTYGAADALSASQVHEVDGSVALLLSRYLHLDVDLQYNQQTAVGGVRYPLRETRRMRRDEVHHLDSPRLGVLAMVSRVESGP